MVSSKSRNPTATVAAAFGPELNKLQSQQRQENFQLQQAQRQKLLQLQQQQAQEQRQLQQSQQQQSTQLAQKQEVENSRVQASFIEASGVQSKSE